LAESTLTALVLLAGAESAMRVETTYQLCLRLCVPSTELKPGPMGLLVRAASSQASWRECCLAGDSKK